MRKLCLATIATLLFTGSAFAQASGNFSATAVTPACMINFGNNGKFTNNSPTCNLPGTTTTPYSAECGMMAASIKTSNGSGVTLNIRPSLDTVLATWSVVGQTAATQGSTAQIGACVGPGIITVTQMKVFNNSGSLLQF